MTTPSPGPAVGIGWRPEIDLTIERLPGVEFVEVIAEGIRPQRLPESLRLLRARGIPVVPHGVSLSLGGAQRPAPGRLAHLGACAAALDAPLVSEHIAFVRADGREAGHLLPVPRTPASVDVISENVRIAQDFLGVPVALENIAAVVAWPDDELTEAQFLAEILDHTGARLLLDVANLVSSAINFGADPIAALDALPLDRIAYVHVAGGELRDGVWHDTHTSPVSEPILTLLTELAHRTALPAVMLERDGNFPAAATLSAELAAIRTAVGREPPTAGAPRATMPHHPVRSPHRPGPSVAPALRRDLAAMQSLLAEALVGLTEPPPRFDADRLGVARSALVRKRSHAVARHAPAVAAELGDRLGPLFADYAESRPKPPGGASADVAAFLSYLATPPAARGRRPRRGGADHRGWAELAARPDGRR
ncbi:DUF692 family multinuclear iron-containing protein [Kutzneria buriramensis]|uniref:SCO6045-like C-terminal domain-containing protein n=1 Tax=Kutzneria buriramensis TaxID=1045776 RepID=A0A3E0GXU0_9PSEU|nr:hypothetical protein BCF44_11943 [Kutzneria buriramensis]